MEWGVYGNGEMSVQTMGGWGKVPVQTVSNLFLKTLTKGAVTTESGRLLQYLTALTENADPLLRRWLAPWSTLPGRPLKPCRVGVGGKVSSDQYPKGP